MPEPLSMLSLINTQDITVDARQRRREDRPKRGRHIAYVIVAAVGAAFASGALVADLAVSGEPINRGLLMSIAVVAALALVVILAEVRMTRRLLAMERRLVERMERSLGYLDAITEHEAYVRGYVDGVTRREPGGPLRPLRPVG